MSDRHACAGLSDEALVMRLAVGDARCFATLIERHRRLVFAVLLRATGRHADAEDLFQDTWLRVARGASRFDPARPFTAWLRQICTRLAIDWIRARATRGFVMTAADDELVAQAADEAPSAPEALAGAATSAQAARALALLPERLREAVLLRYFEDQSEQAMAAQLAVPAGTVKSRLHGALRALRAELDPKEEP